jgi:hypothetical protein
LEGLDSGGIKEGNEGGDDKDGEEGTCVCLIGSFALVFQQLAVSEEIDF